MEHSIYIAKCNRVEGIINTFTDYIAQIDLEIKELINQAPVIAHQMDLLMSVDGVGERVALKMIMETDAFTSLLIPGSFAVMQELFRSSMCQEVANVLKIEYLIGLTRASSICYIWRHYLFHK